MNSLERALRGVAPTLLQSKLLKSTYMPLKFQNSIWLVDALAIGDMWITISSSRQSTCDWSRSREYLEGCSTDTPPPSSEKIGERWGSEFYHSTSSSAWYQKNRKSHFSLADQQIVKGWLENGNASCRMKEKSDIRWCYTKRMRAYRSFVVVSAQEIKQRVHAVLVLEQFRREVAIEKLHSVANGFWQRRAREGSIEGLEIQLQLEVALAAD